MNSKVCIITSVHPPFDGRIFHKEAKSLLNAGYDVVLIGRHTGEEIIDGIRIVPLPHPRNRFQRMTKILWLVLKSALKEKAHIYHLHDPELIPVGIILKLFRKKIIYDVHELVFPSIEDKKWLKFKLTRKLFQLSYLFLEKLAVTIFEQLILAEDNYEEYFLSKYKNFKKYVVVRNFPILSMIDGVCSGSRPDNRKQVIIYAGGLSKIRGTEEMVQAMEHIGAKAELWLLGEWENEDIIRRCESSPGWKHTKYLGLLPLIKVYAHMKKADIGASLLYPLENYLASLPTKAFEYMACSMPMVMSNFSYWESTFRECALFSDPYNPRDIADKFSYLLANPEKAAELGKKGRKLVEEEYSWEAEHHRLLDIYEHLHEENVIKGLGRGS